MNRSALFVLRAVATAPFGARAHTDTDNARVVGVEAQYENVSVPHQRCRTEGVVQARPVTSCRTASGVRSRVLGYQVGCAYLGQHFSTRMQNPPGPFVPVRVSVEPVGR